MAVSKIKKMLEYVQTQHINSAVLAQGQIAELTIPSDGTYLISWSFAFSASAWFNGSSSTSSDDYFAGPTQIFVRECQANETIWLKNGAGSTTNFYGTFTAIKLA